MIYDQEKGGAACPIFPQRGRRAVVLCDGPPPDDDLLEYWLTGADLFVCTDAAGYPYDHLPVKPHVVIGDFDSLTGRILSGREGPRFLQVDDQDTTDSEKALLYLESEGFSEAVMVAADGWRLDHTLYNCHLLERFAGRMRICLATYDADCVRVAPDDPIAWNLPVNTRFSLLPLAGPVRGVVLEGARYPVLGGEVFVGGPATISNQVVQSPLLLSLREGSLIVSVERGPAETAGDDADLDPDLDPDADADEPDDPR
ncbi:MAG: thiamine diphosphokinase [Candidatus Krumholzibacteriia bacterium]